MDLRAMLNTEGGAGGQRQGAAPRPPSRPVQPPPLAPHQSIQSAATSASPATPIQSGQHPQVFRDYSHSTHASPVAHHEYPPHGSPSHHPPAHGNYAGRPPVPPRQPPGPPDVRSPATGPMGAPSPYRHTPSSSGPSGGTQGYPFPAQPSQPPPASPGQRSQYGSQSAHPREPYQGGASYGHPQYQQPPQSPTVGTPGSGGHGYLQHQRSISVQSSSTPTPTHGQQPPYGVPYSQGSPAPMNHHPSPRLEHHPLQHHQQQQQQHHHHRQASQPPTPLGPPPRQSPAMPHQQPPSPFQQRQPSFPPQPIPHASPQSRNNSTPRMSSNSVTYDAVAESHRRSESQHSRNEREQSMSVSPRTRVSSIPSSAGGRHPSTGNEAASHAPQQPGSGALSTGTNERLSTTRESTPAKRKLDDRDLHPEELQNNRRPPPPGQVNGQPPPGPKHEPTPVAQQQQPQPTTTTASPAMSRQRRVRHSNAPVWALGFKGHQLNASRNFYLRKHGKPAGPTSSGSKAVNGDGHQSAAPQARQTSRHPSPEAARAPAPKAEDAAAASGGKEASRMFEGQPFPWENSIEGTKPIETASKMVADFIFMQVMNNPNIEEIRSRGIPFEIEAKLGTIIDRQTNDRLHFPTPVLAGECILQEGARVAFRSSMTDQQHQELNQYLNQQTQASQMHKAPKSGGRLEINYKHRREKDRFYELPNQMFARLPLCVSGLLNNRGALKARVTYDQGTGEVLAKIIKARVADLHIYMPHLPLDCRISINLEWEWDGPVEEITQNQIPNKERLPDRNKDRLSYTHGFYQVDLTQVTQQELPGSLVVTKPTGKEHELEVELDAKAVMEHCNRARQGLPHKFPELVDGLLDNIRVLARRCPPA
ncbi:CYTH-like domain-containing protein [Microdochium bolleyi]|uniref:mRNA-capping enzyme subunit beta n=1 Tax=Microdochium bolleyi TaxID=196109 RepID=A0A136IPS1_9PEZI|nr:CYTH-like domain-containing protein [Microdochium bolleyi]